MTKRVEMKKTVATVEAVKKAFKAQISKASLEWTFGEPTELGFAKAKDADGHRDEKAVKAFRVLSFKVSDNDLGVQTVAMACGHGVPSSIDDRNYNFCCYVDEFGFKSVKNGQVKFTKPVLALSWQTAGYRQLWGGVEDTFVCNLDVDDQEDEMCTDWYHAIFVLRTNLQDGGILIQSSSSAAFVVAEKKGHEWTLTLCQPVTEDGRISGRGYESMFRAGYNYYCSKTAG